MRKSKGFNFRWKLAENYTAAFVGAVFLWFFVNGVVYSDSNSVLVAVAILLIAPFLVTYIDRKSSS